MGKVHAVPPKLTTSGAGQSIRAASPVASTHWQPMAIAQNWLFGRGNTLVSAGPWRNQAFAYQIGPGDSLGSTHYIAENATTNTFLWLVTLSLTESGGSAFGTFRDYSDNVIGQWSLSLENEIGRCQCFKIPHQGGDLRGTFGTYDRKITLRVTSDGDSIGDIFIANIKLIEMPRTSIATITDQRSLQSGEPIFDDGETDSVLSLWGCQKLFIDALSAARRACLLSFAPPDAAPFSTTNSAFELTGSPLNYTLAVTPTQPRSLRGEATTTLEWIAIVQGTGGAGELRIRTGGAPGITDTVTVTIASGGPTVMHGTITARTEDVDNLDNNGWRGDSAEYPEVMLRVTTATSVQLFGFWLREQR
jgi:hypothetical protein